MPIEPLVTKNIFPAANLEMFRMLDRRSNSQAVGEPECRTSEALNKNKGWCVFYCGLIKLNNALGIRAGTPF